MLFFLYGEDSFRSNKRVLEIKNKFQTNDNSQAGLSSFDAQIEKNTLNKIETALKNTSLFSNKKLLIIRNIISASPADEQAKILIFFKKNLETLQFNSDCIIIFWEDTLPRKNNAFFKFLLLHSKKQNFEKLTGIKLEQWTLKELEKNNSKAKISHSALDKLIAYSYENTTKISQEIEKLVTYANNELISDNMLDLLIETQLNNDIFKTIEALAENNKKLALGLLHQHLNRGDDPFYLLSMFIYQFRNLLRIASLQENGVFNEFEIAKISRLHPYVVKKSFTQAKNFGEKKLLSIYKKLGAIDTKIKTGQLNIQLALDKFIGEL